MRFVSDAWICLPIAAGVIAGSLGFPVLFELRRTLTRPRRWSLHSKMTVSGTVVLLVLGTLLVTVVEWDNPATLGPLDPRARLLAGFFQGVMPRSAGFNSLDYGQMREATLLGTDALMFIGGGSAGTSGGIKVTTFLILLMVIVAEARGDREVTVFDRRIGERTQRQALSLALLSLLVVVFSTFTLVLLSGLPTSSALFEVTSAFSTTGLSTGVTGDLPWSCQLLLTVLMFLGRLGPITFATALALRDHPTLYTYPEGRPIIG
jgi:Trk-type K+ transport system membrane component